jgi:hypothetical protein
MCGELAWMPVELTCVECGEGTVLDIPESGVVDRDSCGNSAFVVVVVAGGTE